MSPAQTEPTEGSRNEHERIVTETLVTAIVGASEDGYWLLEDASFRSTDDGQLIADVFDDDGQVLASYPIHITVGGRLDAAPAGGQHAHPHIRYTPRRHHD